MTATMAPTTTRRPTGLSGPRIASRTPDGWVDEPYTRFTLTPYSPTIGAEVHGLTLGEPLDDATFADLHRALLEWKVLFVRDAGLTSESHHALGLRWGELESHPFIKHVSDSQSDDAPAVVRLAKDADALGRENVWHSDVTWRKEPSLGSLLHAIEVPAVGGDTLWADMAAAYDCLDDDLKARDRRAHRRPRLVEHVRAGHAARAARRVAPRLPARRAPRRAHASRDRAQDAVRQRRVHPAHRRPRTPTRAPSCSTCCTARRRIPEYQCRFRWTPGALAIWDNRSTQHYATSDYFPQRRVMERITVIGDRPY